MTAKFIIVHFTAMSPAKTARCATRRLPVQWCEMLCGTVHPPCSLHPPYYFPLLQSDPSALLVDIRRDEQREAVPQLRFSARGKGAAVAPYRLPPGVASRLRSPPDVEAAGTAALVAGLSRGAPSSRVIVMDAKVWGAVDPAAMVATLVTRADTKLRGTARERQQTIVLPLFTSGFSVLCPLPSPPPPPLPPDIRRVRVRRRLRVRSARSACAPTLWQAASARGETRSCLWMSATWTTASPPWTP